MRSCPPPSPLLTMVAGLESAATVPLTVSVPSSAIWENEVPNTANSRPDSEKWALPGEDEDVPICVTPGTVQSVMGDVDPEDSERSRNRLIDPSLSDTNVRA